MCPFKNHLSIFPGAGPVADFAHELKDYKTSKGMVQFTLDHPIPDALLKAIILRCVECTKKK